MTVASDIIRGMSRLLLPVVDMRARVRVSAGRGQGGGAK